MSRLSEIFKRRGRCFIPFVTAGHPDLSLTRSIILELVNAGADIVEIGIPFSDPIADGPIIQASSFAALQHGHGVADFLQLVADLRRETDAGLIFMTYLNPILSYGLDRLESDALAAGLDGLLVSDLTAEEYQRLGKLQAIDCVFLAAPTSSDQRLERIAACCRGFLYLVARTGVTGRQTDVLEEVPATLDRIRHFSSLPVAVGFGIRSSSDVRKVWEVAEGVVVGSAIVDFIANNQGEPDLTTKVGQFVRRQLLAGLDRQEFVR